MRQKGSGLPLVERFWVYVDKSGGDEACWPWVGALTHGYGRIRSGGRDNGTVAAHKVAYEIANGKTKDSLRHTCFLKKCVNPKHIIPTTKWKSPQRLAKLRDFLSKEKASCGS